MLRDVKSTCSWDESYRIALSVRSWHFYEVDLESDWTKNLEFWLHEGYEMWPPYATTIIVCVFYEYHAPEIWCDTTIPDNMSRSKMLNSTDLNLFNAILITLVCVMKMVNICLEPIAEFEPKLRTIPRLVCWPLRYLGFLMQSSSCSSLSAALPCGDFESTCIQYWANKNWNLNLLHRQGTLGNWDGRDVGLLHYQRLLVCLAPCLRGQCRPLHSSYTWITVYP